MSKKPPISVLAEELELTDEELAAIPAYSELSTPRQRRFCEEYCTGAVEGKPFVQVAAARVAGYREPEAAARVMIRKRHIRDAIEARLAELGMGRGEVLNRLTTMARATPGDIIKIDPHGGLALDYEAIARLKHLIKEFTFDSNGLPKIKFFDPHEALRDLAKVHGLFREGLELTGAGGAPLDVQITFVDAKGGEDEEEDSDE